MTFFFRITSPDVRWLRIHRETLEDAEYYIHNCTEPLATRWEQVAQDQLPNGMQFRQIGLSVYEGYRDGDGQDCREASMRSGTRSERS
jgi:hypothetical protein